MRVSFRQVQAGGIDRLLSLMAKLYSHDAIPWSAERARSASENLLANPQYGSVWFILAGDDLAGYFVLTIGFSLEFAGRYGLLDEFYIDDPWRGQGIGRQALEFVEQQCRAAGLKALRLEVGHDNPGALRLYRRTGFEVHDRHLMTKWF